MSIKIMSAVFESKVLAPTDRLIMLSLADHAGEDGTCYPSIARLCQRTGLGERAIQVGIKRLREAGHLSTKMGGGRGNATLYSLHVNPAPETPFKKPRFRNPVSDDINPAYHSLNPAPDAPEPLVTIIEPKKEDIRVPAIQKPDLSMCFEHFNRIADSAGWPKVQVRSPSRIAALSHRVKDVGGESAWCEAMDRAALSPLLTGQNNRSWRADFDWLCKPANFTKLMEGNYDPRTDNSKQNPGTGRSGAHNSLMAGFAAAANIGRE